MEVTDLVAVLAEPNRRRLLQLLGPGEQTVTQLAGRFTVSRSAISQHLGVLADVGLVTSRRAGRFQYYRLDAGGMAALHAELESFWTRELDQLVRDAGAISDAPQREALEEGGSMAFEKSVLVPLTADETFALITEPDRLRRWQVITARVDLRAGGDFRWTVIPGNSAAGTFTEVDPGRRVVFTWGWEGSAELPPGASTVTITLEPEARGLDGEVKVGPHEMPAGAALGILSIEFLVHAWDFAEATSQRVVVSDEVSQHVLDVAGQIIRPEVRAGGSFADPVEAGPDADILGRLIAFTGRAA